MNLIGLEPMLRMRKLAWDNNEMNEGSKVKLGVLNATSTFSPTPAKAMNILLPTDASRNSRSNSASISSAVPGVKNNSILAEAPVLNRGGRGHQ